MTEGTIPLLQTKLHRPRVARDMIPRPQLLARLDEGVNRQLTLVCAPAGFGKTTLVSAWLESMAATQPDAMTALPSTWLSLDENDSDIIPFLRYFIAALRTIFTDACGDTLALLRGPEHPPSAVLHATLSNDIEQLPGNFILVLDDYHCLRGAEVHDLLNEWARHWPRRMHLVLISRINPPIPLSSLRAKGKINEIRTKDLRFTALETTAYLGRRLIIQFSKPIMHLLEERFEGWIVGLQLASLSLRSAASREAMLSVLSSQNADISGYLVDEVLAYQVPAIQTFLLKTSILDRFCAPLCEAVLGETDSAWNATACLDWIERSDLFIAHLDNRREWYRYHQLFRELLQQRLTAESSPDQVNELHCRASAWFEEQGLIDEAIQHALAAGNHELVAHMMKAGLRDVLNREDRLTLEQWSQLLPEEFVHNHPWLLLIKIWALQLSWQLGAISKLLPKVEALLDKEGVENIPADEIQLLRGQVLAHRAQEAYFSNRSSEAKEHCQEVLGLLPSSWTYLRGAITGYLGMSMQAIGEGRAAEQMLLDIYASLSSKTDGYALRVLLPLCFNYLSEGRLEQTVQTAQIMLQGAIQGGLATSKGWAHYFLGIVHYQWNDLDTAEQHISRLVDLRYRIPAQSPRNGMIGMALIHQARGEWSKAAQVVEMLSQFDLERNGYEEDETGSLRARVSLDQGDLENASRWADGYTKPVQDRPLLWLETPHLTRARVLLVRNTPEDGLAALQILDALYAIAERTYNTRYKLEILAVRALGLATLGKTSEADAALIQAVELSRLGGFLRVFIDLGQPMQERLRRLARQGLARQDHSMETIRRILAAFPEDDKNRGRIHGAAQAERYPVSIGMPEVEPLTPREMEVLSLLREPLSIKEIANKLYISYPTVKRHTINLYGKLGVNRRWDAVTRAEELKILLPH